MASIQERLQQAREEKLSGPIRLKVPGFADGSLVARYRPVEDWASIQAFIRTLDPAKELEVAADTLLKACEGVEAHIDGEVSELPHKLGRELAGYLGFDVEPVDGRAISDRQALFLMLPQAKLMRHYDRLMRESGVATNDAEDELVGESQAG